MDADVQRVFSPRGRSTSTRIVRSRGCFGIRSPATVSRNLRGTVTVPSVRNVKQLASGAGLSPAVPSDLNTLAMALWTSEFCLLYAGILARVARHL